MVTRLRHVTWYLFCLWRSGGAANFGPCDKEKLKKNLCKVLPSATPFAEDEVAVDARLKSIGTRTAVRAIWKVGILIHIYAMVMTAEGVKKKPSLVPKSTVDVRRIVKTWAGTAVTPEIVVTLEGGAQNEQKARKCNDIQSNDLDSGFLPPPCIVWSDTLQILLPGLTLGQEYVAYFAGRSVPQLLCRADRKADENADISEMELCLGKLKNGTDLSIDSFKHNTLHQQVFSVSFKVTKDDGVGWIATWTPPPGYNTGKAPKQKESTGVASLVVVVIVVFFIIVLVGCYVKKQMNRTGFARFSDDIGGSVPPDAVGAQMHGGVE